MRAFLPVLCAVAALLPAVRLPADSPEHCAIRLVDATAGSGIDFLHTDGASGKRYIVESIVGGLALFDYDGDGWIDIYFLNGGVLKGSRPASIPRNALYRNNGDWTFTDVTSHAGVGDTGHGLGVVVGDYDNDGDADLYVNNFGPNVLYANNGDGTFAPVGAMSFPQGPPQVGAGAVFLDVEGDGDLDLYSANYVDFNYDNHIVRKIGGHLFHPGPKDYRAVADQLFLNDGNGSFTDFSESSGIARLANTGMGAIAFDCDDDGDTDIFVCNDAAPNFLLQNDGSGHFTEVGLAAGVAVDFRGTFNSSMGVDCGDYDHDGRLDLFMTSFSDESPVMYRNLGGGFFEDATLACGAGAAVFPHANWGAGLVDFDNDGDRDLFIANGHFMDNIRHIDDRTFVKVRNTLLMNVGGKFVDVTDRCGDALKAVESSRAAGFDDLDNDGDIDAVVLNANARPMLIRNESPTSGAWTKVRLIGLKSNRDGAGARVEVRAGSLMQVAEAHLGRGYQSHYGATLHFGLGENTIVERIEVRWPSGATTTREGINVNQARALCE